MQQNKFKIVIPSYNNESWLEPNIASILNQTYKNYEVLYIDDCSTDETFSQVSQIVSDLPNWRITRNETNMRRGYNLSPYNPLIIDFMEDDEDILLFVDGDDWLYENTTLEKINELYNQKSYWMTYGSFICYPSGDIGNPQNTPYPDEVHLQNAYRKDTWRASHLRTFKWHLYKQIKKEDLIFTETGEFYFHAEDLATSFPCLEMCPKEKIGVVPFLTYVYNVSQEARVRVEKDDSREPGGYHYEVQRREREVRNRIPYEVVSRDTYMTNIMSGGLGNMMFQVATAYALSKSRGHKLVLNPNHVGTLHKPPSAYKDNVFKNIEALGGSYEFYKISEESFSYKPLPSAITNIILDGYFQSYKYFEDYQDEIRELFKYEVPTEYNPKGKVSVHVRRGNYTQLSNHHHNLDIKYYLNAVTYFPGHEFLIFSDDIEWCKLHFEGKNFTFVEGTTDVEDLYLMSQCEHNVTANSTFSWWGAFLNRNPNKIVIYPDKWFGPANSEFKTWDLFPPEWICLTEEIPAIDINLFDDAFVHLAKPNGRYSSVHDKTASKVRFTRRQNPYQGITISTDQHLLPSNIESKYSLGWLLETREVSSHRYDTFEEYMNEFDFVMTHDQKLLDRYPDKTRFTIFGGTWIKTNNYGLHPKTKGISMIYSDKQYLTGHKLRHEVARSIQGIDLFGRGTPRPLLYKEDALVDYRYSIVIENAKTENYFTEKLVDALIVGTVPVYWGCPNIEMFFNTKGIIVVNSLEEIQEVVGSLTESDYISRIEYIKENIELAKQYAVTEDWMYENILKDLK
jgi:glycosyltransferase involved in cell wall biosynthesis